MLKDVLSFKQKCLVSPKQSEHLKILGEKFKVTPLKERFSLIYPLKKACFKKKEAEDQLKVNVLSRIYSIFLLINFMGFLTGIYSNFFIK